MPRLGSRQPPSALSFTPGGKHGKNTTHSENLIVGITITKSIKTTRQWSQQPLQVIVGAPTSIGTCRVAVAALAGTDNKICEQAT
jgi:hypothetical protein